MIVTLHVLLPNQSNSIVYKIAVANRGGGGGGGGGGGEHGRRGRGGVFGSKQTSYE